MRIGVRTVASALALGFVIAAVSTGQALANGRTHGRAVPARSSLLSTSQFVAAATAICRRGASAVSKSLKQLPVNSASFPAQYRKTLEFEARVFTDEAKAIRALSPPPSLRSPVHQMTTLWVYAAKLWTIGLKLDSIDNDGGTAEQEGNDAVSNANGIAQGAGLKACSNE
jgi:hypothetical protein